MIRRLIVLILVVSSILGCQENATEEADSKVYKRQVLSFGTQIDITLYDVEQEKAAEAINHIEAQLDVMHDQWHAWRKSSLTKLNQQLVSGEPFVADENILPLVIESKRLYQLSDGLFNPAIGKLIELWGFYRDNPQLNEAIPEDDDIKRLLKSNPNMNDITITDGLMSGSNTDLQIDFGGYAKGYGVDQLTTQLISQGIDNALINAGGDIRAIGQVGDRPWKIAIQHPNKSEALGWIELEHNENVFSSGDYRRNFISQGKSYHHIIDPRTGYPSEHARAVTVIHSNGAVADASATALMVASSEQWFDIAKKIGLKHILIVDRDGKLYCDKLFAKRLHLMDADDQLLILGTL